MVIDSKKLLLILGSLALAPLAVACGEDAISESGGANGFSTSVTTSADIDSLSNSDTDILCAEATDYVTDALPDSRISMCTIVASVLASRQDPATDDAARQVCHDKRDECLGADANFIDDDCLKDVVNDCSATVGEWAACVQARTEQVKAIFERTRPCSDVNLAYLDSDIAADFAALPSECNIIQTVCPSALEDGDIFDDDLYDDTDIFE